MRKTVYSWTASEFILVADLVLYPWSSCSAFLCVLMLNIEEHDYESQCKLIYSHLSKLLVSLCSVIFFFWAQSITVQFLWSIAIISSACSHHFWKTGNDFFIKIICFSKNKTTPKNPTLTETEHFLILYSTLLKTICQMDYFPSYLQHVFDIPLLVLVTGCFGPLVISLDVYWHYKLSVTYLDDVRWDIMQKINHTFSQAFLTFWILIVL